MMVVMAMVMVMVMLAVKESLEMLTFWPISICVSFLRLSIFTATFFPVGSCMATTKQTLIKIIAIAIQQISTM